MLSELHNVGEIDFLNACRSDQLDGLSGYLFFQFKQVFCQTLPTLSCTTSDAVKTCGVLFEKAPEDLAADRVYDSFRAWIKKCPQRIEQGLSLIKSGTNQQNGIVRTVLLAGAQNDLRRFAEEALALSHHTQANMRLGALVALGAMSFQPDDHNLDRVLKRFEDIVSTPNSDIDIVVAAFRSALSLFDRVRHLHVIENVVIMACNKLTPIMRHEIALGLMRHRRKYTEHMIDSSFAAIQKADNREPRTIDAIDRMLYNWDIDRDRQRVLGLVERLLSHSEHAIDLESLGQFRYMLKKQSALLSWYAVSMLLTGTPRLCIAASDMLADNDQSADLEVDLAPFALDATWVLYLARKVIGYCLANVSGSSALLLSCLRTTLSGQERTSLERLILEYLLINHPNAIKYLEENIPSNDPAGTSIIRLSQAITKYLEGISKCANCRAFDPNEIARQSQAYRQQELLESTFKEVRRRSVVSQLAERSVVLYGSRVISHLYAGTSSDPYRKEIPLSTFAHAIEIPRLSVLDPIGLSSSICHFRLETPPS